MRDAIDGVKALLGILERSMPQELRPLRDALSQLQIAYAREVARRAQLGGAGAAASGHGPAGGKDSAGRPRSARRRPGPAQASGRLWVPGS